MVPDPIYLPVMLSIISGPHFSLQLFFFLISNSYYDPEFYKEGPFLDPPWNIPG